METRIPERFGESEDSGMRWRILLAAFGLSINSVVSFAQRPPGDQPLEQARPAPPASDFFSSSGVVLFQLIQGRLGLDPPRHRKGSQRHEENGLYENITVTALRGIPSLHYLYRSEQQQITVSVQQARSIRIESWLTDCDERSVLVQPKYGEVTFSIRRGDLHDHHSGATLIHLRHTDSESFDRHYGLLIERMLRGESLQVLCDLAGQLAIDQIDNDSTPTLELIEAQVEQLRSSRRSVRVSGERQLLSWGTPIVPALIVLSAGDLDTEQSARLRSIADRLRPRVGDTPSSLAKLLVNDRTYWAVVADRLGREQFQLANRHLERFGADPLLNRTEPTERIAVAND